MKKKINGLTNSIIIDMFKSCMFKNTNKSEKNIAGFI